LRSHLSGLDCGRLRRTQITGTSFTKTWKSAGSVTVDSSASMNTSELFLWSTKFTAWYKKKIF
jgi:hypothetical protein